MPIAGARRAEAVEVAKEIFWSSGYADASIADIVAATGLNRYALYSEFGGKRDLFLAALESYFNDCDDKYGGAIRGASLSPLASVRLVLDMMAEDVGTDERGCLMCQVAVEVAREDATIADAVAEYFQRIRNALEIPLRIAAEMGDLNPGLSPQDAAVLVFDAKLSLGVHARAGAKAADLQRIIQATMAAITAPPRT